jgi:hypothetical protein
MVLTKDGRRRTVGLEIEFGGLPGRRAAELIQARFGGTLFETDPHAWCVEGTALGSFNVALDIWFAHPKDKPSGLAGELQSTLVHLIGVAVGVVVPYEIITPPIPLDRLDEIEALAHELGAEGASGTEVSPFYAFGVHFNPEPPDLDPTTIISVLKAYALLGPWLRREVSPDRTRRFLGFAQPFDNDYVRRIAGIDYWPDIATLIDDYVDANPSRNRDLDVLPLFAWLDEPRVRARLPTEKISRRPTFHYRLPDSRVSDAGWSLAPDWNRWVAVERLAGDRRRLDLVCERFLSHPGGQDEWADTVPDLAFG